MILMISSNGETLGSQPSLRFGRAPYFIQYDLEQNTWEAHPNEAVHERGGAGVASTQFLIDHKANAALSGSFGPNAFHALSSAGIKMWSFDGSYETVQSVIDGFKENRLEEVANQGRHQ